MGHEALSMNAIIANRPNLSYSKDPDAAIEKLIQYTLNKLAE
jgi:uridine phosphorylase